MGSERHNELSTGELKGSRNKKNRKNRENMK